MNTQATLLYDSDCGFCRWATARILAWDRTHRIRALSLRSDGAADLLSHLSAQERLESWHLVTVDGTVYSAGRAAAPLLRLLPGGSPVATVASSCPNLVDRAYMWAARHREDLGRIVGAKACAIGSDTGVAESAGARRAPAASRRSIRIRSVHGR